MYSSSNSFLGAAGSARPGQPPFAQQPQYSSPFPSNQQQSHLQPGFAPQPTGYPPQSGPQLQPQPTGFPGGQLQPQFTGFPGGPPQQHQQQQTPPQQSFQPPPQQPQFTSYAPQNQPPQSQPPQLQVPATTGLPSRPGPKSSSEIADSFRGGSAGPPEPPPKSSASSKVPSIRLSFITAQDQAKFEQLFKSAVGDNQAMDGEKAKELLMRSKLPGSDLSNIWVLSDTTKSGQLLFPEFALAMYLCNLRITGRDLPSALPERIKNEVSSMVDIISFQVPDTQSDPAAMRTNVPNFDAPLMENKFAPPTPQQPQPQQPSNSQLLTQLTAQPTGLPPQPTGLQPQPTAMPNQGQNLAPQPTGFPGQQPFQQQPTGFMNNPQPTGYTGPRPPMPPMPTGFGSNLNPAQTGGPAGIAAQPTGVPGQWGFVNAPTTGLPNIEALKQQLMPQPGREGGFSAAGLSGNATVPWAITKDEKRIYDDLFRAWDGFRKGYVGGDTAIEIMGQSGLNQQDLERVWTLADPHNRGRLNMDEFAVAMHLIYRNLNGYPIPNRLPPELVPPSTRNLDDSIGTVKSLLSQDAESRKTSGAFLQPQKTGVSYLKEHSFRGGPTTPGIGRKDATMFKNNDEAVGYRSSARRRVGNNARTPSPAASSQASEDELSAEQLRKKIRETHVMLDAIDFQDEGRAEDDDALDRRDRKEAESLMDRIRRVQDDIDTHPNASFRHLNSGTERRSLRRQLQSYQDQVPQSASDVRRVEREIAEAKLELFRLKDAKAHPDSASNIVGTGPGGTVTEADRIKARARARMQARAAELSGKPAPSSSDDGAAASRLESESASVKADRERNDAMTRDVEDSVRDFATSLEDGLKEEGESSAREHERRRWEDALGVENVIRDFIYDLSRGSRTAHIRKEEESRSMPAHEPRPRYDSPSAEPLAAARPSPPPSTSPAGGTHEDRVAAAKERAQKRIAERMAAAGLKPQSDSTETVPQRQEREKRDRDERLKRAEEEDAKREQERHRRLAEEQRPAAPAPKPAGKKPPPAPPSRRGGADNAGQAEARQAEARREEEASKAEQAAQEQAIKEEQQAQEEERKRLEDAARQQEAEVQKEKDAQEARLRALEEQVKQGKMKKQEEKRRKEEADRSAKEKEAVLAAQRAELDVAKERERQLQLELEGLDEESSSEDDGPTNITPQDSTPTQSQVLPEAPAAPAPAPAEPEALAPSPPQAPQAPPPVPPALQIPQTTEAPTPQPPPVVVSDAAAPVEQPEEANSPVPDSPVSSRAGPSSLPSETESKNPYFRRISQQSDSQPPGPPPVPQTTVTSPKAEGQSTNPFHRLAQQESTPSAMPAPGPLEHKSRARPEEDDWSAAGSEFDSSEDDEDDRPGGGSAKQLASILFGTMGPPRPLSPMEDKTQSKTPTPVPETPAAAPAAPEANGEEPAAPTAAPPPPPPPAPAPAAAPAPSYDSEAAPPPAPAPVAPPPPPPGAVPPPPAPPSAAGGGGPPGDRSALLGSIQAGASLKKAQTNDRSTSTSAGRVL